MLQSEFPITENIFNAQKVFTDRIEPREVFRKSMSELSEKPQEIINYYGKGGIGKTKLLDNLKSESQSVYDELGLTKMVNIFISLEAYDYANPVEIMMGIRNGVEGDCGLFDYALLQYCAKARMTPEEITKKKDLLSSPVMSILNEAISLGTMSVCIPVSALSKCVSLIKDLQFKNKNEQEIKRIANYTEFEIFRRLPHYLGLCISNALRKGKRHVIFFDSYESLLLRTVRMTPSIGAEDWVKELFLSSKSLRVVIASRDRMRWDKDDAEWKNYINQHLLDNLSLEDREPLNN